MEAQGPKRRVLVTSDEQASRQAQASEQAQARKQAQAFPHIAIIFRNAPNIKYPSLIPGPYPESLTRNQCHRMEALYRVVPYKASIRCHLFRVRLSG